MTFWTARIYGTSGRGVKKKTDVAENIAIDAGHVAIRVPVQNLQILFVDYLMEKKFSKFSSNKN